jgi:hypothetical protein
VETGVVIRDLDAVEVAAGVATFVAAAVACSVPVRVGMVGGVAFSVAAFAAVRVGSGLAGTVVGLVGIGIAVGGGGALENVQVPTNSAVAGKAAVLVKDADRLKAAVAVKVAVGNGLLGEHVPDRGNESDLKKSVVLNNSWDAVKDSVGQRLKNMQPGPQAVTAAERVMFHRTLSVCEKMEDMNVRSASNWQLVSANCGASELVLLLLKRFPLFPRNCELLSFNTTQPGANTWISPKSELVIVLLATNPWSMLLFQLRWTMKHVELWHL